MWLLPAALTILVVALMAAVLRLLPSALKAGGASTSVRLAVASRLLPAATAGGSSDDTAGRLTAAASNLKAAGSGLDGCCHLP